MPRKPLSKLMLAVVLVLSFGLGASSTSHAQQPKTCGIYQKYYYSTGGSCVFFCNNFLSCQGNVNGTLIRQVAGLCYQC